MLKRMHVVPTVCACLLVVTTATQAQNSLSIPDVQIADGTASTPLEVSMTSTQTRHAVSLAISYDDSLVSLTSIDFAGTATANADWSEGTICNNVGDEGGTCTADGGMVWSILIGLDSIAGDFDPDQAIPAGTNTVARLNFNTSAMSATDTANVSFQDGLSLFGVPSDNAIVHETVALTSPSLTLDNGSITMQQGIAQFKRCDHDSSGLVDLTDQLNLLTHLFLGGFAPVCDDASDCDNSGEIDISDGVNGLTFLFLGTIDVPTPGAETCGPDPTTVIPAGGGLPEQPAITMGCAAYTGCP